MAQSHKCLILWVVLWPAKVVQPSGWIISESKPSLLHKLCELHLRSSWCNTADILRVPKQHLQFCAVVRAAGRIQTSVEPVAEVTILPDWYPVGSTSAGLKVVGTCERL
jgi:hypothetical protein